MFKCWSSAWFSQQVSNFRGDI